MATYKNEQRIIRKGYVLVKGIQDGTQFGCPDFPMEHAETVDGQYIGSPKTARMLVRRGISPQYIGKDSCICSIGFCSKDQKWYGWSHRAICGFGVGYVAKQGHVTTESGWIDGIDPNTGRKDAFVLPVGFEVKTLDDAKRAAIAFAKGVA